MSDTRSIRQGGLWRRARRMFSHDGLKARVLRSSIVTMWAFGGAQILRMASNLVLTRLLFPEAFGLMALVQMVLTGLALFSDTGLRTSVVQNTRGDDPDFLNTVWTIKVVRGVILWLAACALAWPMAQIYNEPMLAQILPVAGLVSITTGLLPTAMLTAERHLKMGRPATIGLSCQAVTLILTALLAWWLNSVWALVWGTLFGGMLKVVVFRLLLVKSANRLRWDPEAARELFVFGRWILLSTAFSFTINNADKAILGKFISIGDLGIYNVGVFLAGVTFTVCQQLKTRVLMPVYRMRPLAKSEANRDKIFFLRRLIVGVSIAACGLLAFISVPLVHLLYDERYVMAGPIVTLVCLILVPRLIAVGAGELMLVNGDSKRAMYLNGALAITQTLLIFLGAQYFGIGGAILAPGLAVILTHPLRIHYARLYEGWDVWGDALLFVAGIVPTTMACWIYADEIRTLFT